MIENGRDFIFAIKESAPNELLRPDWDDDAGDFLDSTLERIRAGLSTAGMTDQRRREYAIFYEGMLKGTQLKLRGAAAKMVSDLHDKGLIDEDGVKTS